MILLRYASNCFLRTTLVTNRHRGFQHSRQLQLKWQVKHSLNTIRQRISGAATKHVKAFIGVGLSASLNFAKVACDSKRQDFEQFEAVSPVIKGKTESSDDAFKWSRLWFYLKNDLFLLFVAVSSALVVAILNIKIPTMLGDFTDVLSKFAHSDKNWTVNDFLSLVQKPAVQLFTLYAVQAFITFVNITSLSVLGERLSTRLKTDLFSSVMSQDITFFDIEKSGEITTRIVNEVQEFKSAFKMCISQGLRSSLQCVGCGVSLYFISPQMTLLMLGLLPSMVIIGSIIGRILRRLSHRCQIQSSKATSVIAEALGNVRTVRAFAMEDAEKVAFEKEQQLAELYCMKLSHGIAILQALTNMALNGVVGVTLLLGGYLMSNHDLDAGSLMAFLVATQTIQRSLGHLSLVFGQYFKMVTSGSRIFTLLDMKPSIRLKGGWIIDDVKGLVEFRNVTFSYPTRPEEPVLKSFNFELKPGKVTAVVGSSGAGKSTLVCLLERFYDVTGGSITVDGVDVRRLDPLWLRRSVIGYISQEPVLFGTTIFENIRYGKPDATEEEVYKAAKLSNAESFINSFPLGYQTVVGERGVTLSGGQKQRIAIARALIKNPSILILDEATSALDTQSEKQVQEALEKLMYGRTVLVIAHRLSTIKNADEIFVMSHGKIVESGTHENLVKRKGIYWKLINEVENE